MHISVSWMGDGNDSHDSDKSVLSIRNSWAGQKFSARKKHIMWGHWLPHWSINGVYLNNWKLRASLVIYNILQENVWSKCVCIFLWVLENFKSILRLVVCPPPPDIPYSQWYVHKCQGAIRGRINVSTKFVGRCLSGLIGSTPYHNNTLQCS